MAVNQQYNVSRGVLVRLAMLSSFYYFARVVALRSLVLGVPRLTCACAGHADTRARSMRLKQDEALLLVPGALNARKLVVESECTDITWRKKQVFQQINQYYNSSALVTCVPSVGIS